MAADDTGKMENLSNNELCTACSQCVSFSKSVRGLNNTLLLRLHVYTDQRDSSFPPDPEHC